ncbi:MAG TPA: SDR family NAD(P)-dependent oxidoreductase [Bryobacterales bacterium]|nr:SDR family NAD(P)-dependent oxidoreductase [Bryobacterales bacterium]
MPADLRRKAALVTGASKGVGKGIALALARAGCDVAVNYHTDEAGARATAAEITALGRRAIVAGGHVGDAAAVDAMLAQAVAAFSRLHIWVNNAGVQTWKPLLELEESEWDRVLSTNLKGAFLGTQRAARHMKQFGAGRIINIGSGSNKIPFPNLVNYTASKGGIEMFTRVAAVELGPLGITVNCVAPGAIEIERTRLEATDYAGAWAPLTPVRRIGQPADVAEAVCFLASDEAAFITGQTLYVDGGLFTQGPWPYKPEPAK